MPSNSPQPKRITVAEAYEPRPRIGLGTYLECMGEPYIVSCDYEDTSATLVSLRDGLEWSDFVAVADATLLTQTEISEILDSEVIDLSQWHVITRAEAAELLAKAK